VAGAQFSTSFFTSDVGGRLREMEPESQLRKRETCTVDFTTDPFSLNKAWPALDQQMMQMVDLPKECQGLQELSKDWAGLDHISLKRSRSGRPLRCKTRYEDSIEYWRRL